MIDKQISDESSSDNDSIKIIGEIEENKYWTGHNWQSTVFEFFTEIMIS